MSNITPPITLLSTEMYTYFIYYDIILLTILNERKTSMKKIKLLRSMTEISQDDMAKVLGMKQPGYGRYENGVSDIPAFKAKKIIDFFKSNSVEFQSSPNRSKYEVDLIKKLIDDLSLEDFYEWDH